MISPKFFHLTVTANWNHHCGERQQQEHHNCDQLYSTSHGNVMKWDGDERKLWSNENQRYWRLSFASSRASARCRRRRRLQRPRHGQWWDDVKGLHWIPWKVSGRESNDIKLTKHLEIVENEKTRSGRDWIIMRLKLMNSVAKEQKSRSATKGKWKQSVVKSLQMVIMIMTSKLGNKKCHHYIKGLTRPIMNKN